MSNATRKQELRAELAAARSQFGGNWDLLKEDANIPKRVRRSVGEQRVAWIGAATVIGFLLSRLPARRKKVYIDAASHQKVKQRKKAGLLLGALKLLVTLLKPAATAYATKKFAELATAAASEGRRRPGISSKALP